VLLYLTLKTLRKQTRVLAHPQIDWEAMYRANQNPVLGSNGQITGYEPAQSHYVLNRTDDQTVCS
jgi:hypothetical protein